MKTTTTVTVPYGEQLHELNKRNSVINAELRDVLTPAINDAADRFDEFIDTTPEAANQIANHFYVDEVPYATRFLPPDLFEHASSKPVAINSETELELFMAAYLDHHRASRQQMGGLWGHRSDTEDRALVEQELRSMMQRGKSIDPKTWQRYESVHRAQVERGYPTLANFAMLGIGIHPFAKVSGILEEAKGQHDSFLLASTTEQANVTNYVQAPVGEYGVKFAERLTRIGAMIVEFLKRDRQFAADVWRVVGKEPELFREHTHRGAFDIQRLGSITLEESAAIDAQEGVSKSTLGLITLLTSERVKGYETDPNKLLDRITQEKLLGRTTTRFGLGVLPPTYNYGRYIPGMLKAYPDSLRLSPEACDILKRTKRQSVTAYLYPSWKQFWDNPDQHEQPKRSGLFCPFASLAAEEENRNSNSISVSAIDRWGDAIAHANHKLLIDSDAKRGLPHELPISAFSRLSSSGL